MIPVVFVEVIIASARAVIIFPTVAKLLTFVVCVAETMIPVSIVTVCCGNHV